MARRTKSDRVAEYGDFQTPLPLAKAVCALLSRRNVNPASIVEPTCGEGSFLVAALDQFPGVTRAVGVDINARYIKTVRSRLQYRGGTPKLQAVEGNFFDFDWTGMLAELPDPLLVIGNPPWVTNTELGTLGSSNTPEKDNFKNFGGFEALTGKSNFDISEWMLLQILQWLKGRTATMAVLCKTVVARKVLMHAWKHDIPLSGCEMYLIDAKASFNASVDACLFVCMFCPSLHNHEAVICQSIADQKPLRMIGYRDGHLIADLAFYERWKHLKGGETYRWRSGIKHDCAKVMQLHKEGQRYRNGFHELVDLEDEYLYPMLKGSEITNARAKTPKRWMLVTQRRIGEDTNTIREHAPKTWKYLQSYAEKLDRRASSIYRNRPSFSVFGVGDYSFAPWKVAVPALYKKLDFAPIASYAGKPVVLDDTCYFVPCETEEEANYIAELLNSDTAREFLSAFIFWDAKRPVTIEVLSQLDLVALAAELGSRALISRYLSQKPDKPLGVDESRAIQLGLFDLNETASRRVP